MAQNQITGYKGERLAAEFLKNLGYKIIERNFRIKGGEIDIICEDGDELVFVEVKTRNTHDFGSPAEAVTPQKIRFLVRSTQIYLMNHGLLDEPFRLDAVTVDFLDLLPNGQPKIEHYKNITNT